MFRGNWGNHLIVFGYLTTNTILMKHYLLTFCLLISALSMSQHTRQENEMVVRLNFKLLNWEVIDNDEFTRGVINDFLNPEGKKAAERIKEQGFDIGNIQARKMFPHFHTSDSISISRLGKPVSIPPFWATVYVKLPEGEKYWDFFETIKEKAPLVIYADPPLKVDEFSIPNDSLFLPYQGSLHSSVNPIGSIMVDSAWNIETGKDFIKVAIFDSGIDHSHEDLEVLSGYSYFDDQSIDSAGNIYHTWGEDVRGHGTGVAGIIAAKRNNGIGVAGIAGGDGSDSSGISLVDMRCWEYPSDANGDQVSMGLIDASRSVGTYHNWDGADVPIPGLHYWSQAPGYGVHLTNHSYGLRVDASLKPGEGKTLPGDTSSIDIQITIPECNLCREAYLFANQNGVTNIVARGNNFDPSNLLTPQDYVPQEFYDSWMVTVGAMGTDGKRLHATGNTDAGEHWYSPIGYNIDLIAPRSRSNIATTRSNQQSTLSGGYRSFNGTSASAPHVTGVTALLMSYWNKPCYSNINLDPADIEYILSNSADQANDNVFPGLYDDSTGWGRLNAHQAMKMIDFPTYQIIHPEEAFISQTLLETDTIQVHVDRPLHQPSVGPLGSQFPLSLELDYEVIRYKYELIYDFSNYMLPTTELLDVWMRNSETNAGMYVSEVDTGYNYPGGIATPYPITHDFGIEHTASIESIQGDTLVTLTGYYYHFMGEYAPDADIWASPYSPIDFWYPINPNIDTTRMAYSIYVKDTTLAERYDFDCYAENLPFDTLASIDELKIPNFNVFPNPGNTIINVQLEKVTKGSIELYDITGKLIDQIVVSPSKHTYTLSTEQLTKGLYFVSYRSNSGVRSKKWIKQ